MRAIRQVHLDKPRPALVLTRESVQPFVDRLTVVPIQTQARGIASELSVGVRNGLDHESVANLDNIITVRKQFVGVLVGYLLDDQEQALTQAIMATFDLEEPEF